LKYSLPEDFLPAFFFQLSAILNPKNSKLIQIQVILLPKTLNGKDGDYHKPAFDFSFIWLR
jgi:hypothetical protein